MDELFGDFVKAHTLNNGYLLAQTLSPVAPPNEPDRLKRIWQSTNSHSVKGDIKHFIKSQVTHRKSVDHEEMNGWVEVYVAYWNALGEILAGESGKVQSIYIKSLQRIDMLT